MNVACPECRRPLTIVRKTIDIDVGLCREVVERRHRAVTAAIAAALAGCLMVAVGVLVDQERGWGYWLAIAGMLILILAAILGTWKAQVVYAVRITDDYAWVAGVHPALLANFPEFPGRR